jgi:hypothetical protein
MILGMYRRAGERLRAAAERIDEAGVRRPVETHRSLLRQRLSSARAGQPGIATSPDAYSSCSNLASARIGKVWPIRLSTMTALAA